MPESLQQLTRYTRGRRPGAAIVAPHCRRPPAGLVFLLCLLMVGCAGQNVRPSSGYSAAPAFSGNDALWSSEARNFADRKTNASRSAKLEYALHDYYQQWEGVPYRYGGRSSNGIDCSSFVRQTLANIESINLPRTTAAQAQLGQPVARGNLDVGDLVFFKTGRRSRHVGIYIGNGRFMHASSSQGVTISRLDNSYWQRHYWQSRRVTTARN